MSLRNVASIRSTKDDERESEVRREKNKTIIRDDLRFKMDQSGLNQ